MVVFAMWFSLSEEGVDLVLRHSSDFWFVFLLLGAVLLIVDFYAVVDDLSERHALHGVIRKPAPLSRYDYSVQFEGFRPFRAS